MDPEVIDLLDKANEEEECEVAVFFLHFLQVWSSH